MKEIKYLFEEFHIKKRNLEVNPHHTVGGKRHSLVGEETCVESEREGVARCALCATGRGLTASKYENERKTKLLTSANAVQNEAL